MICLHELNLKTPLRAAHTLIRLWANAAPIAKYVT